MPEYTCNRCVVSIENKEVATSTVSLITQLQTKRKHYSRLDKNANSPRIRHKHAAMLTVHGIRRKIRRTHQAPVNSSNC